MTKLFILALVTLSATIVCVWVVRQIAYHKRWLALPREDRWHARPVARFGGIGMFIPFVLGNIFLLFAGNLSFSGYFPFFIGSILIFFVGLLDDIVHFNPSTKLVGQIIAVSVPVASGLVFSITPWSPLNILATYLWFIVIVNAVNIIDNIDGLAAGIAFIAGFTLFVIMGSAVGFSANLSLSALALVLGITAGFLVFNFHPASIFMGDAGSLFLGYVLAGFTIPNSLTGFSGQPSALLALLVPITILSIPIFDSILVTASRLLHGTSPAKGGRDHSSHRLVGLGFSERRSVIILYGICAVGGLVAVALHALPALTAFLLVLYALFLCAMGIYLGRVKVYPEPQTEEKRQRWTPLVAELFHKRRIGEVLLDVILIAASYYFAHYLRFESTLVAYGQLENFVQSLPLVISFCLFGFFVSGVYRGLWHFVSVRDIGRYVWGVLIGITLSIYSIVLLYRFQNYSRSVFIIFGILLFVLTVGSRVTFRIFDRVVQRRTLRDSKVNVIIYGAGRGGNLLYEECMQNPLYQKYTVVGFIDDDREKHLRTIDGVTIYERSQFLSLLPKWARPIHEVWVSSSKISNVQITALLNDFCEAGERVTIQKFITRIEEIGS